MEDIRIEINMQFCQMDELSAEDQELVRAAIGATANSYARYSNFNVGAALRLADGSITTGANQENAAFPSGLCAERCAIFAAQSHHPEHAITALAIAAKNVNCPTPWRPAEPAGKSSSRWKTATSNPYASCSTAHAACIASTA